MTPAWRSRLTTKKVFKDIVKAADDYSQGQRERKFIKKETSKIKSKSTGSPKGNPKGKGGKSTQSNKTDGKRPKNVVSPGKTGRKNTGKGVKKNTGKSGSKGKNNGGKSGGKAKKGQK